MSFRMWALLSALFAGLTAVLAKKGVESVPSNLAVAVRVAVVMLFAAGVAVATRQTQVRQIEPRAWFYLVLSGFATGASWLCYFRALKLGPVSQVAPIDKLSFVIAVILGFLVLGERQSKSVVLGAAVICVGVLITLRK